MSAPVEHIRLLNLERFALAKLAQQAGFAMPFSVGLGLIILLIGATMVARSNVDQVTAIAQNQTNESLAIAEAGVARTLAALNQPENSDLLWLNDSDWSNSRPGQSGCPATTAPANPIATTDTVGGGRYRVDSYTYNAGNRTGTLLVEGQALQAGTVKGTTSRVEVVVNVREPYAFPGVYGRQGVTLGNAEVVSIDGDGDSQIQRLANVICEQCTVANPVSQCNSLGRPTTTAQKATIAASATVQGRIFLDQDADASTSATQLPTFPLAPSTAINLGNTPPANLPVSSDPVPVDLPSGTRGAYHYLISSFTGTLTVNTTDHPVHLYIGGTSNLTIEHSGDPERLAIFATAPAPSTQVLTLTSNNPTSFFVYAPEATVKLTGNRPIRGAVWANVADLSGFTSQLQVPDNLAQRLQLPFSQFASMSYNSAQVGRQVQITGPASSWQRVGVP